MYTISTLTKIRIVLEFIGTLKLVLSYFINDQCVLLTHAVRLKDDCKVCQDLSFTHDVIVFEDSRVNT